MTEKQAMIPYLWYGKTGFKPAKGSRNGIMARNLVILVFFVLCGLAVSLLISHLK